MTFSRASLGAVVLLLSSCSAGTADLKDIRLPRVFYPSPSEESFLTCKGSSEGFIHTVFFAGLENVGRPGIYQHTVGSIRAAALLPSGQYFKLYFHDVKSFTHTAQGALSVHYSEEVEDLGFDQQGVLTVGPDTRTRTGLSARLKSYYDIRFWDCTFEGARTEIVPSPNADSIRYWKAVFPREDEKPPSVGPIPGTRIPEPVWKCVAGTNNPPSRYEGHGATEDHARYRAMEMCKLYYGSLCQPISCRRQN